ncbi:Crp/Fnr family transcriptional regulator [Kamptonema animale CS-326]|jgi:CRP-like cAMP-binding protein|uniref:Crp/Fnr family transcriptional regulator n=1 Tax=Kamptonema animale TaxID=92934 RepID=UPI00232A88DB|nr:Crp/Fnr family transcriptional regulator [Kamptonema animale]MDB9515227.1 Crp/Fnr family transcriptional regulator [Kamptonema animale CS-326]
MPPTSKAVLEVNRDNTDLDRTLHFYPKGEEIPLVSQGIWQVCQGLVQLSTLYPTGEEGLLGWVGPSMCFGLWLTSLQTYRATAISDTYSICYSMVEVEASPQLCHALMPQIVRRLRQMEAILAIAGQRRVEDRLYQLLLLLKQEFGQPVAGGSRLNIRLTHHDLANAICTTRVTVTRMLGKLQQNGCISRDSDRHLILANDTFAIASDLFGVKPQAV